MNTKLSGGVKLGYGVGTLGECLAMNTFYLYFLFFLTDVTGMNAGIAGIISAIIAFWSAFTDIYVGNKSDKSRNPKGRRRPFIIKSAIFLGIAFALLFSNLESLSVGMKIAYFLLVGMAFWLALSFTDIPYLSLGSEISDDYEDRNTLRAIANILGYVAMILASSGTLMLVDWFTAAGASTGNSWRFMALIYGVIIFIAFTIAYLATKGKEQPYSQPAESADAPKENLLRSCLEVLKTGPFRRIILYTIFAYGGILIFSSCIMYYTMNNMGMTNAQVAVYLLVYSLMVIAISFGLSALGTKIEKRTVVIISVLLVAAASIIFHFIGMNSVTLYIYFFVYAFAISAYFVQIYSMVYDVCTLDEYITKKERSGTIVSLFYFTGKFVGGISLFIIGWVLTWFGYNEQAEVQSALTLTGISSITLLIPGVCYAIGAFALLKYPINHQNYDALVEALDKRRRGEEYSEDGFKELLK